MSPSRILRAVFISGLMFAANGNAKDLLNEISLLPSPKSIENYVHKDPVDYIALFDAKIESWRAAYNIDAVSYAVIAPGINATKVFGSATEDSVWQVASVSKHIAATALVSMMDDPRISLDTIVGYDIFSNPDIRDQATIRDFMSHTTGMPGTSGGDMLIFGYNLEQVIDTLKLYPNNGFRTQFNYNNVMFDLGFQKASEILGSSTRGELKRFFNRAGMNNSSGSLNEYRKNPNLITMYDLNGDDHLFNVDQGETPASGGVVSTIGDLKTFLNLHLNPPSWLPNLSQIYTPIIASGGPNGNFYGVGTGIFVTLGTNVRGHLGLLTTGVSTAVLYDIENQIGIAVLVNSPNAAPYPLFLYLYFLLRGQSVEVADSVSQAVYDALAAIIESFKCNAELPVDTHDAEILQGTYFNDFAGKLKISHNNDKITVGKLDSANFSYDGTKLGAIFYDVSGEKLRVIATPEFDNSGGVANLTATYYCDPSYVYTLSDD